MMVRDGLSVAGSMNVRRWVGQQPRCGSSGTATRSSEDLSVEIVQHISRSMQGTITTGDSFFTLHSFYTLYSTLM